MVPSGSVEHDSQHSSTVACPLLGPLMQHSGATLLTVTVLQQVELSGSDCPPRPLSVTVRQTL